MVPYQSLAHLDVTGSKGRQPAGRIAPPDILLLAHLRPQRMPYARKVGRRVRLGGGYISSLEDAFPVPPLLQVRIPAI